MPSAPHLDVCPRHHPPRRSPPRMNQNHHRTCTLMRFLAGMLTAVDAHPVTEGTFVDAELLRHSSDRTRRLDHHLHGIAVGTALAGGPPRRSQRALLTHWAPALGLGVEPLAWEGMHHAGGW